MKPQSLIHILIGIACVGLLSTTQAVIPSPDGGYPGFNTAEGTNALRNLTTGVGNAGIGWYSLFSAGVANYNTGVGTGALALNTADSNTAVGTAALLLNTTGTLNTAVGTDTLVYNDTGIGNTAIGYNTLPNNTNGTQNTAIGFSAMRENTTGGLNTAVGLFTLINNTEGYSNTAIGWEALFNNTEGTSNTAIGHRAGLDVTGDNNVCIGGAIGVAGVDNTTWIANVNTLTQNFSAGVNDYVTVRLSDGRLGHTAVVSSQRYKEDIKPLDRTSQALYALKPVSFRLKKQFDPTQALGFGLIAEEVEKVDPALVYCNERGQVESVRYEMVNAMLLNEFLKEHRRNEEQEATIAGQQKQIEALTTGLQKVSAQLEASKLAPQVVNNP